MKEMCIRDIMHTAFSTDSEASPESMIKASIELGLGGICITDHMDYDYPKEHPEDEPEFILDLSLIHI